MTATPLELKRAARPPAVRITVGGVAIPATAILYLSLIVLLPLAMVFLRAFESGWGEFWDAITQPQALAALRLSLIASLGVAALNAVTGTLIAWVLVRDRFRGAFMVDALIDLPFALPTIVAGLTLLALYGPNSPFGITAAYSRWGVMLALLFVTLPFVVRAVQPVLEEVEPEVEEAAAILGARDITIFRLVILPHLIPAILSGAGLGFARAIGEFGSVVLISGNMPFKTEVAAVQIFGSIEAGDPQAAAAVSVVLLLISLSLLLVLDALGRRRTTHAT